MVKEESTKSYRLMNFLRINGKLDERREQIDRYQLVEIWIERFLMIH